MNHGSVAGVLSLGGKIPANSNSVLHRASRPSERGGERARLVAIRAVRWRREGKRKTLEAGRGSPRHIGIFKAGGGPGLIADDPFGNAEQIYRDIPVIWLKLGAAQVGGGDLQAIEQQAGGFGVHLAADNHAHDLSEGDLDGVGVLEHGQNKLACDVMGGVAEVNTEGAPFLSRSVRQGWGFAIASQRRGTACGADLS
jgi:hypothetical protein